MIDSADIQDHPGVLAKTGIVLQYIIDHLELSKILLNNHVDESFAPRLFSLPKISDMLADALSEIRDEKEKEATIAFAIYGSYKLLQDWVNDLNRSDAEAEAKLILVLAGRVCVRHHPN